MLKFILIFSIVGFCFSAKFDCETEFHQHIRSQCNGINPECIYFGSQKKCTKPKECSGTDVNTCLSIIHLNYNTKKCHMNSESCEPTPKICTDYDSTWGDVCSLLSPAGKGDRCDFSYSKQCTPHYNDCGDAPKAQCDDNIPSDYTKKCVWKDNACKTEDRLCDDTFHQLVASYCTALKSSDKQKKCFYLEGKCMEYYEKCESYTGKDKAVCESIKPLNDFHIGYDRKKNCTYDSKANKCQTKDIMCEDYIIKNETEYEKCYGLSVKGINKKCVYDFENQACKEEYESCYVYNTLAGKDKSKEGCEAIILTDPYTKFKKCVYSDNNCIEKNKECADYKSYEPVDFCIGNNVIKDYPTKVCKYIESKCVESYVTCTSYGGDDKETCESIKVEKLKCILEHDSSCIAVKKTCSEAKDESECIIAKATDAGKTCIYYNKQCIENYISCENYIGHVKKECEEILIFNGNKCIFENDQCKAIPKLCSEGKNKIECGAINKVSDPDIKVCQHDSDSGSCFENYKYCSDYRGDDKSICTKIKPYSVGGSPEETYKCVYEKEEVGCEKKLLECSEAKSDEDLCNRISAILEATTGKYCAYIDGVCNEQYKTCEDYNKNVEMEKCKAIIPKNRLTETCGFKNEANKNICFTEPVKCESLNVDDYEFYCKNLNAFCSYSNGICSYAEKPCADVTFMLPKNENAEFCEDIKMDDPKKICTISADKLKCEEKDKEPPEEKTEEAKKEDSSSQNSQKDETQDNNSSLLMNVKGIQLVLVIICLLF